MLISLKQVIRLISRFVVSARSLDTDILSNVHTKMDLKGKVKYDEVLERVKKEREVIINYPSDMFPFDE